MKNSFHYIIYLSLFFSFAAFAERRPVVISDISSSGRTIMINAGARDGLSLKEALLLRSKNKKLVAARVIRLFDERSAVYVVERYKGAQTPEKNGKYNILYGIPLGNIPMIPEDEWLAANPQDERFFEDESLQTGPEIDDESYLPETTVAPKFPPVDYNKANNLSVGISLFRNADLEKTLITSNKDAKKTYQGYSFRYAYHFKSYYWLKEKKLAYIGMETSVGVYNFSFVADNDKTKIQVIPMGASFKYLFEVNRLFYAYPYAGYSINLVSATDNFPSEKVEDLRGGRLLLGIGAEFVTSKITAVRLDLGFDGVFIGLILKI